MTILMIIALIFGMLLIAYVAAQFFRPEDEHRTRRRRQQQSYNIDKHNERFEAALREALENPDIERVQDPHHADPHTPEVVLPPEKETNLNSPISGRIMRDGRFRRVTANTPGRKHDQDFRRPGPS